MAADQKWKAVNTISVNSQRRWDLSLLAVAVALSRFAFRSHDLYDIDSVNFALGISRFDPRTYQPHPPGYFLYVCLGRWMSWLVRDPNLALVLLSILASIGVVILTYQLAHEWFGQLAARFAGLLFLFSPLAWFHGTVALTYALEAFFSALLGYLCWKIDQEARGWVRDRTLNFVIPLAAAVLGVAGGVRPSSLLFLGPIFLYSLRRAGAKRIALGVAVLALTLTAWFVPMIRASGGFQAYYDALASLWGLVPSKDTVFNSSPATSIARACFLVLIYGMCFGAASVAPLWARRIHLPVDAAKRIFTAVWILPGLCFFTFIFLKFVNSGYLLLLAPAACIWLGFWASQWYENAAWPRPLKLALIGICAAVNVLIFLESPAYCSYRSVRHFEAELQDVRTSLPQIGTPGDLLVVSFDNHFLGYRHAGYYLPDYFTLQYPEVNLIEGTRIFAMHGDDTQLLVGLPAGAFSRFVLCPLPNGDASYRQHIENAIKLLPGQDLRRDQIGGHEFVSAPIRDLPLLFPKAATSISSGGEGRPGAARGAGPGETASARLLAAGIGYQSGAPYARNGVYALLHSAAPPVNIRAHPR